MNYLERYLNGEHEKVWDELQALEEEVLMESYREQARAVAAETMRRVRRNCEKLILRLNALGYQFGIYPDGSRRSPKGEPLTVPSKSMQADCDELEAEAGPLPLSLVAFWQEVGAVDFVGRHLGWGDGLDPLVVDPPEGALSFLLDKQEDESIFAALAPDDLHKDHVSGGDPYGVLLPNPSADFLFLEERHNLNFVPYLRLAILRWGGFPGLDGRDVRFESLGQLVDGLEPF